MAQRHVIELAFDLSRMPALARSPGLPPIPPDIIELMRIAAASPEACEAAAAKTGEPTAVVIEAARFFLQHVLFRPEADCYHILGLEPNASRETARSHMRWLLQWLHPDRNHNGWDAVYAERVLKAWRQVSASDGRDAKLNYSRQGSTKKKQKFKSFRLPWIEYSAENRSLAAASNYRLFLLWTVRVGLVISFFALWSAVILSRS
jgi:hypothetical protein